MQHISNFLDDSKLRAIAQNQKNAIDSMRENLQKLQDSIEKTDHLLEEYAEYWERRANPDQFAAEMHGMAKTID